MKLKLFRYEIELRRETPKEASERLIIDGLPSKYGWWYCPECMEHGRFTEGRVDPGRTWFASGSYDWRNYPEMWCACRRGAR